MSLGSGSKSSTSSTNTTYDTTISSVDNRVAEGNAAVGGNVMVNPGDINGSLSISTTDQGAVRGGVDIALESIRAVQAGTAAQSSLTKDLVAQSYGLANEARQSETSGAINKFVQYGAIIAVVGILAWALRK